MLQALLWQDELELEIGVADLYDFMAMHTIIFACQSSFLHLLLHLFLATLRVVEWEAIIHSYALTLQIL